MIQPDLELIEAFLHWLGDKHLRMNHEGRIVVVPPPSVNHAFATEVLESLQPFLVHAYYGAAVRPRVPPSWPWKCPACRSWSMQTMQRSRTRCYCGTKQKRQLISIPWSAVNHHGRPTNPHFKLKASTK